MSRLADAVAAYGVEVLAAADKPGMAQHIDALVREAVVIAADNVAAYYFDDRGRQYEDWEFTDLPCVTPPFPTTLIEWRPRAAWRAIPAEAPHAVGLVLSAFDVPDDEPVMPGWPSIAGARWWVLAQPLEQWGRTDGVLALPPLMFYVDATGQMCPLGARQPNEPASSGLIGYFNPPTTVQSDPESAATWRAIVDERMWWVLLPALLTVSFLHCKNVRREVVDAPPRLSRAHARRHGVPLVRYYTLQIDPMRTVLQRDGASEVSGLRRALHICRGHFAHYETRPLFGKYTGMFWRPSHVRGRSHERLVVKDYAVAMPGAGR